MRLGPQYQRVSNDDSNDNVELGEISNPIQNPASTVNDGKPAFLSIKVLLREQVFEITGLSQTDTVGRLKEFIASATEVPTNRQRLIFSGRSLTPEDKTLSFFNIPNHGSIHLFPLPAISPATAVPTATVGDSASTATNVRPTNNLSFDAEEMPTPMHFDSTIQQHSREVRMWSLLLLFLSTMALFNNVSYYSATGMMFIKKSLIVLKFICFNFSVGKFGSGSLDSVVFILDTIVSGLGSWVGILGLKSVRTLDLDDVRKYVRWLGVVAVFSMIMRVLWVFDVVYAVKRAVKESENSANAGSSSSDSSTGVDTGTGSGETIDSKAITAFGIQATIIAMICLFAWSSCFRRAVSFYRAVQWHDIESQTRQVITVTNPNGGIELPTASAPSVTTAAPSASARSLPLSASVV